MSGIPHGDDIAQVVARLVEETVLRVGVAVLHRHIGHEFEHISFSSIDAALHRSNLIGGSSGHNSAGDMTHFIVSLLSVMLLIVLFIPNIHAIPHFFKIPPVATSYIKSSNGTM